MLLRSDHPLCTSRAIRHSDLRKKLEESVDALTELRFYLFAGAFEQVHGDPGGVAVPEFDGRFAHPCHFLGGKQTQTVYKSQIRHVIILFLWEPDTTAQQVQSKRHSL